MFYLSNFKITIPPSPSWFLFPALSPPLQHRPGPRVHTEWGTRLKRVAVCIGISAKSYPPTHGTLEASRTCFASVDAVLKGGSGSATAQPLLQLRAVWQATRSRAAVDARCHAVTRARSDVLP
eukprot:scaffold2534_cov260-Pinguiococcus_pyrenoidosus.AAC.5